MIKSPLAALVPFASVALGAAVGEQGDHKDCETSMGTIRFQADNPLPSAVVRKLVKARIA